MFAAKDCLRRVRNPALAAAIFILLLTRQSGGFIAYVAAGGALTATGVLAAGGRALADIGATVLLLAGLIEVGERLTDVLLNSPPSFSWRLPFAGALGFAAVSTGLLLIGVAGFFTRAVVFAVFLALCALGVAATARRARPQSTSKPAPLDAWESAALGFAVYLAFCAALRALAPPTDIDVLKYHLALPKLYLLKGRVEDIPWLVFSHWPQSSEMLYALGLSAGSDAVAALTHTGVCVGLVALAYLITRDEFGRPAAATAAILLAAQPNLMSEAGAAMNDGALAFLYLAACACLHRWDKTDRIQWLRAGAMLAGAAAAVKLQGLVLLFGLGGWVMVRSFRRDGSSAFWPLAAFSGWAALCAAPWYAKTWILAGNPIWPFLPRLFGGHWGAVAMAAQLSPNIGATLQARLSQMRWLFFDDGASCLAVPLLVAAALVLSRPARVPALLTLMLAPLPLYLPAAATSVSIVRYLMPFYAPLSIVVAWALFATGAPARVQGGLAAAALFVPLAAVACGWGHTDWWPNNTLYPALGVHSRSRPELTPREAYLSRALPEYDFICGTNRRLRPEDRVLLLGDNRGYYYDVDYMFGDPTEQSLIDFDAASGPAALRAAWAREGISHVVVARDDDWYSNSLRHFYPRTYALVDETVKRYARVDFEQDARTLYTLEPDGTRRTERR